MAPKKTRSRRPKGKVHVAPQQKPRRLTIDILPEDVLLEIFDFYVNPTRECDVEEWCTLVHVCRKWRTIVLGSPVRLNLRIHCHPGRPMREKLDIWPTLPIIIKPFYSDHDREWGVVNIAVALEQNHRICQIVLGHVPTSQMGEILAAMHKPFPVLTDLYIDSNVETRPTLVDPDLFLGGSAPCLRSLRLDFIPFPGLPKLLSSATQLTSLRLHHLSRSGYISPEAMASCFAALTRLKTLILEYQSPKSFPIREHRPPPPPIPTLLPALIELQFYGVSEYLEDLVDRIDTPLLDRLIISLLDDLIPDTTQLIQFINRTPKFKAHDEARVQVQCSSVQLKLGPASFNGLEISYRLGNWEVVRTALVCASSLCQVFSATVETLYICGNIQAEKDHWLKLLRPFTSVKSLCLSRSIVPYIALVLRDLIEESGVLPALQTLFLQDLDPSGSVQEAIGSFVSGRQFSSHPVTVSQWE